MTDRPSGVTRHPGPLPGRTDRAGLSVHLGSRYKWVGVEPNGYPRPGHAPTCGDLSSNVRSGPAEVGPAKPGLIERFRVSSPPRVPQELVASRFRLYRRAVLVGAASI